MELLRQVTVGAFDLFRTRVFGNSQYFIVIARLCRHFDLLTPAALPVLNCLTKTLYLARRQARRVCYLDLLTPAGSRVRCGHMNYSIYIDIKYYFDLRHSARRAGNSAQG